MRIIVNLAMGAICKIRGRSKRTLFMNHVVTGEFEKFKSFDKFK